MQERRRCIDKINEMERWLNDQIQELLQELSMDKVVLLNRHVGSKYLSDSERRKRCKFRNDDANNKIRGIVAEVKKELQTRVKR